MWKYRTILYKVYVKHDTILMFAIEFIDEIKHEHYRRILPGLDT